MFESAVEQKIGQDYENWQYRNERNCADRIFIDAPTGSGKTTFILQTLLPYYCEQGKKILYLVNRRILKEQIREMIADLPHEQFASIRVELYQEIEKSVAAAPMQYSKVNLFWKKVREQSKSFIPCNEEDSVLGYDYSMLKNFSEYDCVVCDEAHYFLTDSTYNTNTIFSFEWIQEFFQDKVCIFMSATIDELKSYMEKNNLRWDWESNTACYEIAKYDPGMEKNVDLALTAKGEECKKPKHKIKPYSVPRDYSYIKAENIRIINNRKALVDLVAEGKHKWLIFVDSIQYGNALKNSVKEKLRKCKNSDYSENREQDVIFLSSGYKRDQNAADEVDRIIRTQASSAKVLIVTAVLDNGVNIKDIEVRNVVLFADTETEFIQMLGRKRKDAQQFKLYIYGYDKNHFSKRKRQLRKQKEIVENYLSFIEKKINSLWMEDCRDSWKDEENKSLLNELEKACIEDQHKKMMQKISDGHLSYEDVRHIFTVYDGKWYLNSLAQRHIENLICYYRGVISKFETEGDDAFAREQLSWLGRTGKIAHEIINESKLTEESESRSRVIEELNNIVGKKMVREEYQNFVDGILTDLRVLAAHPIDFPGEQERTNEQFEKWNTIKREFNKTGKVLSKQSMEFLRIYCRIPFRLDNDRKGGYMVQFADQKIGNM